jgi:UDP-2-acetamido-3-amino-2,3-dideoxy-glucuronate N-acetyltransferase
MNTSPKVAVIGSGYWGKNLVRNFHQLDALGLICDKNESVLSQFKEQYPEVDVNSEYQDVLTRTDIEGVVIAAPAVMHHSMAKEALLAGKHVYVEKPLTLIEKEGEELINLAKGKKRVLMVGHLLQYHPVFARLREMVGEGELGRINYIYSNRLSLGKIRIEENVMWSFAPHDISMILSLAGEKPNSISATGGNYLHAKIADVTTTHLEFPSGLRAHIFVSWLHPFKKQELVVIGDKKMAVFDDTKPWEDKLLVYPHEIHWSGNIPTPSKADAVQIVVPQSEPLRAECQHFLDCITNDKQPFTDGKEGLEVLKVLNASQKSLDNDGIKIDINEVGSYVKVKEIHGNNVLEENRFFVHPTAEIDKGCEIGKGSKIWHFSHVLSGSKIGEQCNIGQNVVIGPDVSIGKECKIQNNVSVYKGVTLENGVFCGPSMVFTNIYNPRAGIRKMEQVRSTLVRKGATIGANATVVCGTIIGRYAFVGAGSVVNKDIPNYALVVGNPSKIIGWACECGERLPDELECLSCGKKYLKNDEGLKLTS